MDQLLTCGGQLSRYALHDHGDALAGTYLAHTAISLGSSDWQEAAGDDQYAAAAS